MFACFLGQFVMMDAYETNPPDSNHAKAQPCCAYSYFLVSFFQNTPLAYFAYFSFSSSSSFRMASHVRGGKKPCIQTLPS